MQADAARFIADVRPALEAGDTAEFVKKIEKNWGLVQLCEMLEQANVNARRVAAVGLGFLGDRQVEACLLRALKDPDREVTQMAEHGLWSVWFRQSTPAAAGPFKRGVDRLEAKSYRNAIDCFRQASVIDPNFAEAHNQQGIAHYFRGEWELSLQSCKKTLKQVPMHFGAISGMGHCYAQLGELSKALHSYRQALSIHPNMLAIASAIEQLQASVRDINEASGLFAKEAV